jgi:hypothetical protein
MYDALAAQIELSKRLIFRYRGSKYLKITSKIIYIENMGKSWQVALFTKIWNSGAWNNWKLRRCSKIWISLPIAQFHTLQPMQSSCSGMVINHFS